MNAHRLLNEWDERERQKKRVPSLFLAAIKSRAECKLRPTKPSETKRLLHNLRKT